MENEEKLMTGEESLRLITEMISKTRVNIRQGSFHLLFWGWLIMFCSVSEYLLTRFTHYGSPWYVWYFVIPGVFVSLIYGFVHGRRETVHTYAERIYVRVWIAFFIAAVVLFVITSDRPGSFAKYILMLAGFPTFVSGVILRFRPLMTGGAAFWLMALAAHFGGPDISALSMPVAIVAGYLIPGYMLKRKGSHDNL